MRKMSMVDKDSCEGMLEIYKTFNVWNDGEKTPYIVFRDEDVPHLVFEWCKGTHGVNVYYTEEYIKEEYNMRKLTGERTCVDYFSFDFDVDKVATKRVKTIIKDHIKEVIL